MSSVQTQEALEKTNRFIQVDEAEVRSHVKLMQHGTLPQSKRLRNVQAACLISPPLTDITHVRKLFCAGQNGRMQVVTRRVFGQLATWRPWKRSRASSFGLG